MSEKDDLEKLIGGRDGDEDEELIGYDWRAIFYDPAGELYRSLNQSAVDPFVPIQQSPSYWSAQRTSTPDFAGQRLTAAQQRQAALREQQRQLYEQQRAEARRYFPVDETTNTNTEPSMSQVGIIGTILGAVFGPDKTKLRMMRKQPQSGFTQKTTPAGRRILSLKFNRDAKFNPLRTLQSTRFAAARAQQVGARLLAALDRKQVAAKKHVVVGAVRQRQSITALKQKAKGLVAAGAKLNTVADKYKTSLQALAAKLRSSQQRAKQVTRIHGDIVVGDDPYADFVYGMAVHDVIGEGDDATFGAPYGTPEPSTSEGSGALPGPPTYGAGDPPTLESVAPVAGVDYQPDPYPDGLDPTFYDAPTDGDLPLGAIIFDGSRVPPFHALGNYTRLTDGTLPGAGVVQGGVGSGYALHDDGWWLLLTGISPAGNYRGGRNYDKVSNPDAAMQYESKKSNFGPLIGNPKMPEWRGLRFSPSGPSGPRWFWFYDQAPQWAKQTLMNARLADALTAYKAAVVAGQTDYVNQQIQDQLDAAEAKRVTAEQAKQDREMANAQAKLDLATDAARLETERQWELSQARAFEKSPELFMTSDGYYSDGGDGEMAADFGDEILPSGIIDDDTVDWGDEG